MSLTIGSLIMIAVSTLAKAAGLDVPVDAADVNTSLATISQLVFFALAWYGRVRQGDVRWFGRRK